MKTLQNQKKQIDLIFDSIGQLEKAQEIATKAHFNQKRKNGESYIKHPERVAHSLTNPIEKIVGWLHDVLEDTNIKINLHQDFHKDIIEAVEALTRREKENYLNFILRISKNKTATNVKIADINDNLSDLEEGSLKDKYRLAKYILQEKIKLK